MKCGRIVIGVLVSCVVTHSARAAPGAGTIDDPVRVDAFPYIAAGSTLDAFSDAIDLYDCELGLDESGAEIIYAFELDAPARVTAWVEGDGAMVDIDVHLLDDLDVDRGVATGCVARANVIAEAQMSAGVHYVVVDTYAGDEQAGDFVLHAHAIGEDWFEMPVAQGVRWRARRPSDLDGLPQVLNVLHVDMDAPGIVFEPVLPPGCATVAEAAAFAGPTVVAAINSSFFSGCGSPVSFMKQGGMLLSTNGAGVARGAFGLGPGGEPRVGRTEPAADWAEVEDGQGGIPLLAQDGVAFQGADAWAVEGLSSMGFLGPNPRTVLGVDGGGDLVLATVDGRRPNAAGMSLDRLAAWSVDALGGEGVVNVDGGGSTSMWIGGVTPSGVVNYPSDGGAAEAADHSGARSVVGVVAIHGEPYNWPPRFQSSPVLEAAVGEPYVYDADAIDLNVEDVVTYAVVEGPPGMEIDAVDGVLTFSPPMEGPSEAEVIISASDGRGETSEQSFMLSIDGATGPSESGADETAGDPTSTEASGGPSESTDATTPTEASSEATTGAQQDADAGCGCRSDSPGPWSWSWMVMIVFVGHQRRTRTGC